MQEPHVVYENNNELISCKVNNATHKYFEALDDTGRPLALRQFESVGQCQYQYLVNVTVNVDASSKARVEDLC